MKPSVLKGFVWTLTRLMLDTELDFFLSQEGIA